MSVLSNIDNTIIIVEEMMNDRGYFYSNNTISNHYIYETKDKKKNTIIIFIEDKKEISQKKIDEYKSNYDNILLIISFIDISENLPSKYINYETNNIQVFHIKELLFNITKHKYVPKHTILTEDEKKKFTEIYNITDIAKIKVNDRVCRYYFAKIGDIIKIIRPSNNSKDEINYRLCI